MIRIFADTTDATLAWAEGFTTNPTIVRRAIEASASLGSRPNFSYLAFARAFAEAAAPRPVSLEVTADDRADAARQALVLAACGENVFVKVPVTFTDGAPNYDLVRELAADGVRVNVTAVTTPLQAANALDALLPTTPGIVSIFAGRIADAGYDPGSAFRMLKFRRKYDRPLTDLLWASPRQPYDLEAAELAGADVITLTPELYAKVAARGRSLEEVSLATVRQFRADALAAGLEF